MRLAIAATALLATVLAVPAQAQDKTLIDARDPARILKIAQKFGTAELTTDHEDDPKINARLGGTSYSIYFYGCKSGVNCKAIQFYAGWDSGGEYTTKQLNEWNRNKRFGKAYIDSEGDPVLEMDVNLDSGVTVANLEDTFDWWKVVLKNFRTDVIND
jgi:hypothetical protein